MTDKEKLDKIRALADNMYYRMSNLTTDTRPIRQAMNEYHQFIINGCPKEEPVSEELEKAALLYYPKMSRISESHGIIPADNKSHYLGDANEDKRKAFIVGAKWKEKEMQSTIELAEDHAMLAGMEKMKEEMMEKAVDGVLSSTITGSEQVVSAYVGYGEYGKDGDKVKVIVIKED